jgi:hypothetical protein
MLGMINKYMIKHKHHIIPKHVGGSDDESNLIELTVEEHAEAHRKLFEEHGRWQDEVAWKSLSGQISKSEINYILSVERNLGKNNPMYGKVGYMKGKTHTDETKKKIKEKRAKQVIVHSEETRKKIGSKHKGKITSDHVKLAVTESNRRRTGSKHKPHKNKGVKQEIIKCPHCNKEGGTTMYRWHFDNCKLKGLNNE